MKKILLTLFVALSIALQINAVVVKSPNQKISLTVAVNASGQPYYSVTCNGNAVISQSVLGVKYGDTEYYTFDKGIRSQAINTINETYTLPHGKRSTYINNARELTVTFVNSDGNNLRMVFRVYNDAVAFRYTLQDGEGKIQYSDEASEFNFANFQNAVCTKYGKGNSEYWVESTWANLNEANGYSEPMLVQAGNDNYVLVTEAAALSSIGTSKIVKGTKTGGLKLKLVDEGSRNVSSDSYVTTPFESPWRTLIIGTLQDVVASTAVENLSPASKITDTSWIKPGRVAWNWAGEDGSNDCTQAMSQKYVDMAAEQGWEYTLLDEGWQGKTNVRDIVNYANEKNVGILLWFNQKEFASDYQSIYNKMKVYADLGIKGMKIDFFDDDRQDVLKKYENMLQAAADLHLLINFHGCTRPSGLERTWPNLMTMEAVYGGEMYMYWSGLINGAHTVNLVLTRNVIGSMDYTPLKFGSAIGAVKDNISWGQQLALMVAYESALQHCSDAPGNQSYSMAQPVMKILPTAWDETRLIEGKPSHYATIARRKGNNWFVAAISADARTTTLKPDFLDAGKKYYAYIYNDTPKRYDLQETILKNITSSSEIRLSLLKNGGATIVFSTELLNSAHAQSLEAEDYNQGGTVSNDNEAGSYVSNIGGNKKVVFTNVKADRAGSYAVTLYYIAKAATTGYLQANDGSQKAISFVNPNVKTNNGGETGKTIGFKTVTIDLNEGNNTLTFGSNGTAPGLDHITVRPAFDYAASDSDATTPLVYTSYEAEYAALGGRAVVNTDANCSNGYSVGNVGGTGNSGTLAFNYYADQAGTYTINVYYMTWENRSMYMQINGGNKQYTNYPATGAWDGNGIGVMTFTVTLPAGDNTIIFGNSNGYAPNVDRIEIGAPKNETSGANDPSANIFFQHADQLMQKSMGILYDKNGNHNNENDFNRYQWSNSTSNRGNSTIWPQGYGLATFANMVLASPGTSRGRYYTPYIDRMFSRFDDFTVHVNGYDGYGIYPNNIDRYLDDNEWAALGIMDSYDVNPQQKYLDQAEMVARYLWGVGYDTKTGGGLYWHDSPSDGLNVFITKNTASNSPAIVLFCRLYNATGNSTYLDEAKQLFKWMDDVLIDKNDYLVLDNINVNTNEKSNYKAPYTTGATLHAATLLYEITGDISYKNTADKLARAAFNRWFKVYNSPSLGKYIHLVDFNNSDDIIVLARAYQEYAKISDDETYINAIGNSLLNTWAERLAPNGLMNYGWSGNATQDNWTSLGQLGYIEMYARWAQIEQERIKTEGDAERTTLEAEQATLGGGAIANNDANCSGGASANNVGGVSNSGTVTFTYNANADGQYKLRVYYMTAANRDMYMQVNDGTRNTETYVNTEAWDGKGVGVKAFTVNLKAGSNTITFGNANDFAPNIDKIEINAFGGTQTAITLPNVYDTDRQTRGFGNGAVYNLNGQRVADKLSNDLPKGIYIVNGRKIIKK